MVSSPSRSPEKGRQKGVARAVGGQTFFSAEIIDLRIAGVASNVFSRAPLERSSGEGLAVRFGAQTVKICRQVDRLMRPG